MSRNKKGKPLVRELPVKLKPKVEWDSYLNDPNRFKLSEEQLLEKKKLLISRNNLLQYSGKETKRNVQSFEQIKKEAKETPTKRDQDVVAKRASKVIRVGSNVDYDYLNRSDDIMDLTALDILDSSEDGSNICWDNNMKTKKRLSKPKREKSTSAPLEKKIDKPNKKTPTKSSNSTTNAMIPETSSKPISKVIPVVAKPSMSMLSTIVDHNIHSTSSAETIEIASQIKLLIYEFQEYEISAGKQNILDLQMNDYGNDEQMLSRTLDFNALVKQLLAVTAQQMAYLLEDEVELKQKREENGYLTKKLTLKPSSEMNIQPKSTTNIASKIESRDPIKTNTPQLTSEKPAIVMAAESMVNKVGSNKIAAIPSKEIFIGGALSGGQLSSVGGLKVVQHPGTAAPSIRSPGGQVISSSPMLLSTPIVDHKSVRQIGSNELTITKATPRSIADTQHTLKSSSSPISGFETTLKEFDEMMSPLRSNCRHHAPASMMKPEANKRSPITIDDMDNATSMPALTSSLSPPRSMRSYITTSLTPARNNTGTSHHLRQEHIESMGKGTQDISQSIWTEIPVHDSMLPADGGDDPMPWLGGYQPPTTEEKRTMVSFAADENENDIRLDAEDVDDDGNDNDSGGWLQGQDFSIRAYSADSPMKGLETTDIYRGSLHHKKDYFHTPSRAVKQDVSHDDNAMPLQIPVQVSETPQMRHKSNTSSGITMKRHDSQPMKHHPSLLATPDCKHDDSIDVASTISRQRLQVGLERIDEATATSSYVLHDHMSNATKCILSEYVDPMYIASHDSMEMIPGSATLPSTSDYHSAGYHHGDMDIDSSDNNDYDNESNSLLMLPSPSLPPRPYINTTTHPFSRHGTAFPDFSSTERLPNPPAARVNSKAVYDARAGSF